MSPVGCRGPWRRRRGPVPALIALISGFVLALSACAAGAPTPAGGTVRLYTSVTQDTVDAVLTAFAEAHPDIEVELFRAPTGELDARIAAERREGEILVDVLWGTDPLSTEQYDAEGLLRAWTPPNVEDVPEAFRQARSWGTRVLNVVIVARDGLEDAPSDWDDLAASGVTGGVALPDPGFAGSALGTMAFFALSPEYGFEFLEALARNGATQVQSPGDVITGVAEGRFDAGITLDKVIRDAVAAGSPIQLVWPRSGSVAIYSPISIFDGTPNAEAAEAFVEFVLGPVAQAAIASTGWQPVRPDVAWEHRAGEQRSPDWDAAFAQRDALLERYRSIFGG